MCSSLGMGREKGRGAYVLFVSSLGYYYYYYLRVKLFYNRNSNFKKEVKLNLLIWKV